MAKPQLQSQEIYYKIVQISKVFFESRQYLTIEAIQNLDPSIDELAKIAKQISNIIFAISQDFSDTNMAINARQCSIELLQLAEAVKDNDEAALQEILEGLKKFTQGPY